MSIPEILVLIAFAVIVGTAVGHFALRVANAMDEAEREENRLLNMQIGDDPIRAEH